MANTTDPFAQSVHGTNPQFLIEKITRLKIYNCVYWKEQCFGLTAETIIDKAVALKYCGGNYGGNLKPTNFLCLVLKLLQLQPEKDIVIEFLKNEDFKYLRALGAFYMRLIGKAEDVYKYLEPLYNDYRKLSFRGVSGWTVVHMDEFIDSLFHEELVCDIALPHLPKRSKLEELGVLEPRISALDLELMEEESEDEEIGAKTKEIIGKAVEKGESAVMFDEDSDDDDEESKKEGKDDNIQLISSYSSAPIQPSNEEKTHDMGIEEKDKHRKRNQNQPDEREKEKEKRHSSRRPRSRSSSEDSRRNSRREKGYSRRNRSESSDSRRASSRSHRDRDRHDNRSRKRRDDSRSRRTRRRDDSYSDREERRRRRSSSRDKYRRDRRKRDRSESYSDESRSKRRLDRRRDSEERDSKRGSKRGKSEERNSEIAEKEEIGGKKKTQENSKKFDRIFGKGKKSGGGGNNGKEIVNEKGEKVVITAPEGSVEYWNQIRISMGMKPLKP